MGGKTGVRVVRHILVSSIWVGLLALFVSTAVPQEAGAAGPGMNLNSDVLTSGTLSYKARGDEALNAVFSYGDSLIRFHSKLVSPAVAKLQLNVNGVQLDATLDAASRTGNWTGHRAALFTEDIEALAALSYELEADFGNAFKLLPHEHLLYRAAMYWGEAPAGVTLGYHRVRIPQETYADTRSTAERGVPEVKNCLKITAAAPPEEVPALESVDVGSVDQATGEGRDSTDVGGAAQAGGCQRPDDDGIVHFTNCSSSAQADLYHDAKGSHCFLVQRARNVGPCTNNCKGRCGPGCGAGAPDGGYTRDCAEHDQCCRIHGGCSNPWDGQCGDEYFDADDDYFGSRKTCDGCGNPA